MQHSLLIKPFKAVLCFCLYIFVNEVVGFSRHTSITFTDNGYKNVMIAVHPDVKESSVLVESVKAMMSGASQYLYSATERRAYYSNVTILIPNKWTNLFSWVPTKSENYKNADIVIENSAQLRKKRSLASSLVPKVGAYTQSYGGCGLPGVRIHLLTDLFDPDGKQNYAPASRLLVHEWAHFRWGVFDEFAQEGEEQFYFSPSTKQLEAVKCNLHLSGKFIKQMNGSEVPCNLQNGSLENCIFEPNLDLNDNFTASIMDHVAIPSITHFCNANSSDSARAHNYESPSRQNRLCAGKSTWSIITEHDDFTQGRNLPRNIEDKTPSFSLFRAASVRRLILAIDTSASMATDDNLVRTRQMLTLFIEDILVEGIELAVITFSDTANLIVPTTQIGDDKTRKTITSRLPSECAGETNIGSALLKSKEVLEKNSSDSMYTFVVIITDGSDTAGTNMEEMTKLLKDVGAIVSVISLSNSDDRDLEILAQQTGGRYYLSSFVTVTALEALIEMYILLDSEHSHIPIMILSETKFLGNSGSFKGSFLIDSSLGNNTRISLTYSTDHPPDIVVYSPTGRRYCSIYPEYLDDPLLRRVKFTIPALAEVGEWKYEVTNEVGTTAFVYLVVTSSVRDNDTDTFKLTGSILVENNTWPVLSVIVAEVIQGNSPLKNLKVKAIVNRPKAEPIEFELFDNGIGADIIKNDGIYSRFFTGFTTSGRYSALVEMANSQGDMMITESLNGLSKVSRAYAGSVHIEHVKLPTMDKSSFVLVDDFPPMRITDLRVLRTSQAEGIIELAWTAPGDDADDDRASYYSLLMSHSADSLINAIELPILDNSFIFQGSLNCPQPFGMKEKVVLKMEMYANKNESLVFAIFAVDDSGNKGEMSNLVTAGFGFVPDIVTQEYFLDMLSEEHPDSKAAPADQKVAIASVVGLAAGLLLVTITSTAIVYYIGARKAKIREEKFFQAARHVTV